MTDKLPTNVDITTTTDTPTSPRVAELDEMLLESLDQSEPGICFIGDTNEQFFDGEGKYKDIADIIIEKIKDKYDIVVRYNPASFRLVLPDDKHKENLTELNIELKGSNGDGNLLAKIIDETVVPSSYDSDRVFIELLQKIIEKLKETGQTLGVLIDRIDFFLDAQSSHGSNGEKSHNLPLLEDLILSMQGLENAHVIGIDRNNIVEQKTTIGRSMMMECVPAITKGDISRILKTDDEEVLQLAMGIPLAKVRKIFRKIGSEDIDVLQKKLLEEKQTAVNKMSEGTLTCSFEEIAEDQINISDEERAMWDVIKNQIIENPEVVSPGTLLMGPPGVGKTMRAKYLASKINIPFMEMEDVSSSGLRGKKEDKVRKAFQTAIKNKPCIFFIDEIDKLLPRTEGKNGNNGNDDNEVAGYIQRMIGSKEMQGVILLGATNDPNTMNESWLRARRFGTKVYVPAPENIVEKKNTFNAVLKQQILEIQNFQLSDEFVDTIISLLAEEQVTGADFDALLKDAYLSHKAKPELSYQESIMELLQIMNFKKSDKFQYFINIAKELHNAPFKTWKEHDEGETKEPLAEELQAIALSKLEAKLREREKIQETVKQEVGDLLKEKDEVEKKVEAITLQEEKLQAEVKRLEEAKLAINKEITEFQATAEKDKKIPTTLDNAFWNEMMYLSEEKEGDFLSFLKDNEDMFTEDTINDHGEALKHIPLGKDKSTYVLLPKIIKGAKNKTYNQHENLIKKCNEKVESPTVEYVIPPIEVLAACVIKNLDRFQKLSNGKMLRLRSSTKVPDLPRYHGNGESEDDDDYEGSIVGEYFEVVLNDPEVEDNLIDINTGHPTDIKGDKEKGVDVPSPVLATAIKFKPVTS